MTIQIENIFQLVGFTDHHLELIRQAETSLKMRTPFFVGSQGWVIVGITMNERRQEIQIRGVRISDKPPARAITQGSVV